MIFSDTVSISTGKLTISSAELPSHKTRWSSEEDQRLKDALVNVCIPILADMVHMEVAISSNYAIQHRPNTPMAIGKRSQKQLERAMHYSVKTMHDIWSIHQR